MLEPEPSRKKIISKQRKPKAPACSFRIENSHSNFNSIVGVDEAGRGCLAGPVVVAGVVFSRELHQSVYEADSPLGKIRDSKLLEAEERRCLYDWIKSTALAHSIVSVSHAEVDRINILQATFLGARQVVAEIESQLQKNLDLILMDGPYPISRLSTRRQLPIIDGDQFSKSIAAASILAKVHRDALMDDYSKLFGNFGFDRNKGYATSFHVSALREYGPTEIHRQSFLKKYEHLILGTQAEKRVTIFLEQNGFTLVERNWRTEKAEIDIIAERQKELHFFEVRSRSRKTADLELLFPKQKKERFLRAVQFYLSLHSKKVRGRVPRVHFVQVDGEELKPFWDAYQW